MAENERYFTNPQFVTELAQRIKRLRESHGHTQEYLIGRVHLSINCYETGSKISTLMSIFKICAFYDITLAEFFKDMDYLAKTGKPVEAMPSKR